MSSRADGAAGGRSGRLSAALGVIPLAVAFGFPSAVLGFLAGGVLLGSLELALGLTAAVSVAMAAALSREREAPLSVALTAVALGLLSGVGFFLWGISGYNS